MARSRRNRETRRAMELSKKIKETRANIIRIQDAVLEYNMSKTEANAVKYTRRGMMEIDNKEYYFVANRFSFPIVFGATNIECMIELSKALDNKMREEGKDANYFKENPEEVLKRGHIYLDELDKGILIIKTSKDKFIGYMPGKTGCRAVTYRRGGKPYSCAVKSLIKDLDRPGKQSFRTMEGQGESIRQMIPKLMEIVKILDDRTNNPEPEPPKQPGKIKRRRSSNKEEAINNGPKEQEIDKPIVRLDENGKKETVHKRTRHRRKRHEEQQKKVDINNLSDKDAYNLFMTLLEKCKDNGELNDSLIFLSERNAEEWLDYLSYGPDFDKIAELFKEYVTVLSTDEDYKDLATAINII